VFFTYFAWDVWTKFGVKDEHRRNSLFQRGWASASCAILAFVCYEYLSSAQGPWRVAMVDASLLSLVFLFRAMKMHNFSDMPRKNWHGIAVLLGLWLVSAVGGKLL
jgi:hypothetical protein